MLDEDLPLDVRRTLLAVIRQRDGGGTRQRPRSLIPLQSGIDVSATSDLQLFEPLRHGHRGYHFFGNLARRLAKPFRQLERKRHGELAHFHRRRRINHNAGELNLILLAEKIPHVARQLRLSFQVHDGSRFSRRS